MINRGVPKNVYVIQYSPDLHYDKIERVSHGNGMNRLSSNFAGIGLSLSRCSILERGASWIFLSYIGITIDCQGWIRDRALFIRSILTL